MARGSATHRLAMAAAVGVFLVGLSLTLGSARAQPYLGWDFGNGFGIGIGPPPSAYNPCPDYGWGPYYYPYGCRYYPPRAYYAPRRHRAHVRRIPRPAPVAPATGSTPQG